MTDKVDLYDSAYGNYAAEVYRQIRMETYGEDLGQTSWVTTEESNRGATFQHWQLSVRLTRVAGIS